MFIGLNLSFFLIQNSITLITYITRVGNSIDFLNVLSQVLDIAGTSLSSFFGILLINSLLSKEISKEMRQSAIAISVFQFLTIGFCDLFDLVYLEYISKISIVLVIFYEIFLTVFSYHQIGNKDLKKAVNKFALISLAFLPLFIFEAFRSYIPQLKDVLFLKLLSLPAYFLVINIFTLVFANQYFNSPAFIEDDKLTEFFIKKYAITDKEVEVIEFLLTGLTYKQIAEKLCIANKTVDNHIQNIYRKLEVTSKIQLFNLVRSKEN